MSSKGLSSNPDIVEIGPKSVLALPQFARILERAYKITIQCINSFNFKHYDSNGKLYYEVLKITVMGYRNIFSVSSNVSHISTVTMRWILFYLSARKVKCKTELTNKYTIEYQSNEV